MKVTGNGQEQTVFVYNAMGQMVAEYNNQPPASESQTSYVTSDTLGTPRVITKADGSVKSRHDYLPFGEEITSEGGGRTTQQGYVVDNVRQKFTGYERDYEIGLDYAQARYFSASQARFTSVDPLSGKEEQPQSWNKYSYCLNSPLVFIDPTGMRWAMMNGPDGTQYRWFDDDVRDERGLTAYGRAVGEDGWSVVHFNESEPYEYQDAAGLTIRLNPAGPNPKASEDDSYARHGWVAILDPTKQTGDSNTIGEVYICSRPAEINVFGANLNIFGFRHEWIKTSTIEAGLGPEGGAVPGEGGSDSPFGETTINLHPGRSALPGSVCERVPDANMRLVNSKLQIGQHMGTWVPGRNDCQTFARDVIFYGQKGYDRWVMPGFMPR